MALKSRSADLVSPPCRNCQAVWCWSRIGCGASSADAAGNTKSPNRGAPAGSGVVTGFFAHDVSAASDSSTAMTQIRAAGRGLRQEAASSPHTQLLLLEPLEKP